ncbi:uncharacterized protein SPPG_05650 [Spizellomyces punctatus DAOM BR117]|uniref:Uncharacterized protein n=1 Tax=Spizellomyces punctatus (strain DAOM BR117) TaxID=645134 RepID=A0A0L0HF43_SPIPD|nr:uncharacterized protein SPPG_05650 [Spizellomyces punctatus DAOM BR117]KNC99408.1 hypothetical protein SPPG_05650 [Spizellomyces punctatus DAOM BR117]|eukprot:XP_016607448.1 hypothetical protein SPPG_05650 [Spizellomyces punctatus DAOM BR117]
MDSKTSVIPVACVVYRSSGSGTVVVLWLPGPFTIADVRSSLKRSAGVNSMKGMDLYRVAQPSVPITATKVLDGVFKDDAFRREGAIIRLADDYATLSSVFQGSVANQDAQDADLLVNMIAVVLDEPRPENDADEYASAAPPPAYDDPSHVSSFETSSSTAYAPISSSSHLSTSIPQQFPIAGAAHLSSQPGQYVHAHASYQGLSEGSTSVQSVETPHRASYAPSPSPVPLRIQSAQGASYAPSPSPIPLHVQHMQSSQRFSQLSSIASPTPSNVASNRSSYVPSSNYELRDEVTVVEPERVLPVVVQPNIPPKDTSAAYAIKEVSPTKSNKKKITLIAVILLLVVAIALLVPGLLGKFSKSSSESNDTAPKSGLFSFGAVEAVGIADGIANEDSAFLMLSQDDKWLFYPSNNGQVIRADSGTGSVVYTYSSANCTKPGEFNMYTPPDYSTFLYTCHGAANRTQVLQFNILTGALLRTYNANAETVSAPTFASSGFLYATMSRMGTLVNGSPGSITDIVKWSPNSPDVRIISPPANLSVLADQVYFPLSDPRYGYIGVDYAGGVPGVLRLDTQTDTFSWDYVYTSPEPHMGIKGLAVTPNGRYLYSTVGTSSVVQWDITTKQIRHFFNTNHGRITGMGTSPDSSTLITFGTDFIFRAWSVEDGKLLDKYVVGTGVLDYSLTSDGRTLYMVTADKKISRVHLKVKGQ